MLENSFALEQVEGDVLHIRYVPLSAFDLDLQLWEKNLKLHDLQTISESIAEYGYADCAKWDSNLNGGSGGFVYGNGRSEALILKLSRMMRSGESPPKGIGTVRETGEWVVPVKFGVDAVSETQASRFALSHNIITMQGGSYQAADIARMFSPGFSAQLQELADTDALPVGFDGDYLSSLLRYEELEGQSEEDVLERSNRDEETTADLIDRAEGGAIESRVSLGQVWKLGRHLITCGDSTNEGNVRKLIEMAGGRSVGMVWADAPYGISIVAANGFVGGGEAYDIPFGGVKNRRGYVGGGQLQQNLNRRMQTEKAKKVEGLGSIGGAKPFGSKDVRGSDGASNVVATNKYAPIIGDDTIDTAVNAYNVCSSIAPSAVQIWWGGNYFSSALPNSSCWIVWDKENTGNFADAELAWTNHPTAVRVFRHMWNGMVKASEHGQRRVHPTQKPIALCEWAFEKYGKPDDLILDPFLGSAPSIIAAQKMEGDRTVIGFELSPEYCEVICRRFESFTGQTAELVGNL